LLTVEISLPEVEELQKLVQEGLEKGVLNYDEIAAGLEDVELTKEQIEDFYTYLVDHGWKARRTSIRRTSRPRLKRRKARSSI
jgi:hypothetical protein